MYSAFLQWDDLSFGTALDSCLGLTQAREIVRLLLPGGRVISVEEVVAVLIKARFAHQMWEFGFPQVISVNSRFLNFQDRPFRRVLHNLWPLA